MLFIYSSFSKFPSLELRLAIAIVVSIILIFSDGKLHIFLPFKNYMENSIYLFYRLCNQPNCLFRYISTILVGYKNLILEINALREELFLKNSELLLVEQYKEENYKLHALLNSPVCKYHHKLIAKIFFIKMGTCNQQAIINQGMNSDVYVGQPVIADLGVVGQIVSVHKISSRILLISDSVHALSVKIKRNNIPMILMGRGNRTDLYAEYPGNIDICLNDMLVTSGLDGRFPEGYPVATVSNIKVSSEKDSTVIRAKPTVTLQNLRYVILIWE